MIRINLNAILFAAALVFQTTAWPLPATGQDIRNSAIPAELRQNAIQLLASVSRETGQFKLAENRVRARTIVADLMWEHDEQAAGRIYQNAFTELRSLIRRSDREQMQKMSTDEVNEHYINRFRLTDLRREYVLTLAARDSAAAVDALPALKTKPAAEWDPPAERLLGLKLETATVIAVKDPNRAYAIYKEEIAANGITLALIESFDELHRKNPELTARIARDIFAIVKTAKIGEFSVAGTPAKIAIGSSKRAEIEFWQVTAFLNAGSKLQRRTERDRKMVPPLAEGELKELAELFARAFLTAPNPGENTVNQAMTSITRHAPEQVQSIRQKVGEQGIRSYQRVMESDTYYLWLEEKTAHELAIEAERTDDLDKRDLLYEAAVEKALAENMPEKAQIIAARIKNREAYAVLIEEVEIAIPLAAARRGDQVEVRRLLTGLNSGEKRITVLTELAGALVKKGDVAAAKKMLDEAVKNLFTALPTNESNQKSDGRSHLEIAGKFAAISIIVDPDETFANIETIIEAINAEIKRKNSSGSGTVKTKELFYDVMERELLLQVPQTIELLNDMARTDFARTVKLIEKFERPEIRLLARLRLTQSLLDPRAAEKEKKMLDEFLADMDG